VGNNIHQGIQSALKILVNPTAECVCRNYTLFAGRLEHEYCLVEAGELRLSDFGCTAVDGDSTASATAHDQKACLLSLAFDSYSLPPLPNLTPGRE
jgi:hypothetical protein